MISDSRHADALRAAAREARNRSWRPWRSTLPALRPDADGGRPVRVRMLPPQAGRDHERSPWWPALAVSGWAVVLALMVLLAAGGAHAQTVLVYARADQSSADKAAKMAGIWSEVWTDRQLQPGETWRAEVARRLLSARLVLVLWSARAAASAEVGAEWRIALACARCQVVPVLLDDAPLPGELGRLQGVDWR